MSLSNTDQESEEKFGESQQSIKIQKAEDMPAINRFYTHREGKELQDTIANNQEQQNKDFGKASFPHGRYLEQKTMQFSFELLMEIQLKFS